MRTASIKQFAIDLYNGISNHNVFNGAAALAYYLFLSIFPAAIVLLSILPYLPIPHLEQAIMDLLAQALPKQSADLFTGIVNSVVSRRRGGLLSFGIVFVLWSASSGLSAIMQQLDITYEVQDSRPYWKFRGTALLLMVLFLILVIGGFSLIIFGGVIQDRLIGLLGNSKPLLILFATVRWIIVVVCLLLAFAMVYYFGPDVEQKFRFISPGSVFGVVLLALASLGFQYYVTHFSNYSLTYGSIGAVIILQLWLYISGMVLLLGGEVNVLYERSHPEGKGRGGAIR